MTDNSFEFLKEAPATDSFVEAAGQTVTYYLKAWTIIQHFKKSYIFRESYVKEPLFKISEKYIWWEKEIIFCVWLRVGQLGVYVTQATPFLDLSWPCLMISYHKYL